LLPSPCVSDLPPPPSDLQPLYSGGGRNPQWGERQGGVKRQGEKERERQNASVRKRDVGERGREGERDVVEKGEYGDGRCRREGKVG
jgi:hypothetical protein